MVRSFFPLRKLVGRIVQSTSNGVVDVRALLHLGGTMKDAPAVRCVFVVLLCSSVMSTVTSPCRACRTCAACCSGGVKSGVSFFVVASVHVSTATANGILFSSVGSRTTASVVLFWLLFVCKIFDSFRLDSVNGIIPADDASLSLTLSELFFFFFFLSLLLRDDECDESATPMALFNDVEGDAENSPRGAEEEEGFCDLNEFET